MTLRIKLAICEILMLCKPIIKYSMEKNAFVLEALFPKQIHQHLPPLRKFLTEFVKQAILKHSKIFLVTFLCSFDDAGL